MTNVFCFYNFICNIILLFCFFLDFHIFGKQLNNLYRYKLQQDLLWFFKNIQISL